MVLPEPAPATTSSGPAAGACSTAARCAGFSSVAVGNPASGDRVTKRTVCASRPRARSASSAGLAAARWHRRGGRRTRRARAFASMGAGCPRFAILPGHDRRHPRHPPAAPGGLRARPRAGDGLPEARRHRRRCAAHRDAGPSSKPRCTEPWDIVLSDYHLPGFGGLEALQMLRASGRPLPFILVSGQIGEETAVEAMRNGASDYLLKDNLTRLAPAVEHAIAASRSAACAAGRRPRTAGLAPAPVGTGPAPADQRGGRAPGHRARDPRRRGRLAHGAEVRTRLDPPPRRRARGAAARDDGAGDGDRRHRGQPAHHAEPAPGDPGAGPGGGAAVDDQPLREAHRHRLRIPHQRPARTPARCRRACRWWPTARRRRR